MILRRQVWKKLKKALSTIYRLAAEKSLKTRGGIITKKIKNKNRKPWYDTSLVKLKRSVQRCGKKLLKDPNNADFRRNYFMILKIYRKSCKRQQRKFRQELICQLDDLNENNPKAYWELVKKLKSEKAPKASGISASDWLKHFSKLTNKSNFKQPSFLNESDVKQEDTI